MKFLLFSAWIVHESDAFIVPTYHHKAKNFVQHGITMNQKSSVYQNTKLTSFMTNNNDESEKAEEAEEAFTSVALEWAKEQAKELAEEDQGSNDKTKSKKYVVVGAGWAGWGAVKALCQSGITEENDNTQIILMDALPDPTGATPYLSKTGKPVEAGTRGFWKDYPNIYALCDELDLDENKIFTPYTNSSFYSPDGLEATAPVFSEARFPFADNSNSILSSILPESLKSEPFPTLPSPLGQILATFPLFERIPLEDRASMVGLLIATIDALGAPDESTKQAYDRMTAHDLFIKFGLSPRLVQDFIKPTLLVGLFKPPEELSALVVMELLYYYALAHQDSFDVRWIKNGTVADSLVLPLANSLLENYDNVQVLGGSLVKEISIGEESKLAHKISYLERNTDGKMEEKVIEDVDGVILAVGCKGMRSIVSSSPDLARLPVFASAALLQGIDVISTRIWLDKVIPTRTPANVFSRFEALRGAGGTFFMLDQLQTNDEQLLWGEDEVQGSVVACDFYNAGSLINLPDEDLVDILMKELLPSAVPQFADANVVDSWIGKYPGTVSWFSPGSYTKRPPLEGAGKDTLSNVKCAGDWVDMGEREHGAKGLCQERAFVSGIEAANALLRDSNTKQDFDKLKLLEVKPVREDEPQFQAGVKLNNFVMQFIPRFWVR